MLALTRPTEAPGLLGMHNPVANGVQFSPNLQISWRSEMGRLDAESAVHDEISRLTATLLAQHNGALPGPHALPGLQSANVVCCSLKILPSKLRPSVWYPGVISFKEAFWEVCQSLPLTDKHVGKVARGANTPPKHVVQPLI